MLFIFIIQRPQAALSYVQTIETTPWISLQTVARFSKQNPGGFEVTGTTSSKIDIVVEGDTARVDEVSNTPLHVHFHSDPEAYVLVMYGRLSLEAASTAGRVRVEGNRQMAVAFGQWFKGI